MDNILCDHITVRSVDQGGPKTNIRDFAANDEFVEAWRALAATNGARSAARGECRRSTDYD
jgi:hypothetical protein